MTLDEFRSQYRLLQRLTQRGVASYQATDASGRVVMVHSLDSASRDEVDHVRGMLHALGPADRTKILTILDVDGAPIVVTEYLQGFETLARWLELRTRGDATLPGTTPVKPDREPVGNFTELFGPPQPPKAPVLEGPPVPAEGSKEAGEFTRMFGALPQQQSDKPQSPPQTPSTPTSLPPPAPPPPPAQSEPPKVVVRWRDGSPVESAPRDAKPLIRWKQAGSPEHAPAPPPAPAPAPAPAPPPAKTPGEFTRLFGPQDGASLRGDDDPGSVPPVRPQAPLPEPLEALPPPLPPRAPPSAGGGFTQLLRAAADVPDDSASPHELGGALPPPPATGTPAQQGEFTRLMAGLPPSPGSGPAAPRTPAPAGPSEFTRMMSGVPTPPPPVPRAAPPPAEPAAEEEGARPAPVMLFVALGVVFVLAAAVVVFFALR